MNKRGLSLVALSTVLIFSSSCKTQEEIKREQMVNNLALQMTEGQKVNANTTVRLQQIEERLGMVSGQIEETDYKSKQEFQQSVSTLQEKITVLEESNKAYKESITQIEAKLEAQEKFLDKILKTLNSLTNKKKITNKKKTPFEQAVSNYRGGKYKKAKPQFEALLASGKFKGTNRARILHSLGIMAYVEKDNQAAMGYFGKLFTEHSKSGYNGSGLLHLARTFVRLGEKEQAKETLNELIKRFPKHRRAQDAKKMLKTL